MQDLLLIAALGFLGSFGHCAGMCGPLTVAFALSKTESSVTTNQAETSLRHPPLLHKTLSWQQQLRFHSLLNLGRLFSYSVIGAGIGALSSVLVAGGQLAGIDSGVRRGLAIATGIMLVWFGLKQLGILLLPRFAIFQHLRWHDRLSQAMTKLSLHSHWWATVLLGMVWGGMPCGFLYAAQIKAAATGHLWLGGATMLAFGLGTLPVMLGVGVSIAMVSADQRSQLTRMGGWLTVAIGTITIFRSGDIAVDYTGHAALLLLMLALVARPVSQVLPHLLRYRRAIGVGAFVLAVAHAAHMLEHSWGWNLRAITFMLPIHQVGMWAGIMALACMTPAACTSFDGMVKALGKQWRYIHLLSVPALGLSVVHALLIGSHYFGSLQWSAMVKFKAILLVLATVLVFLIRRRSIWAALSLSKFYAMPANKTK